MPDVNFAVETVRVGRDAATPTLMFDLRISTDAPVDTILLRCQIQIEAARRRYTPGEKERLRDLFGEPDRWGETLRPLTWIHVGATLPPLAANDIYPLSVPCTFDFNVAACKYFHALEDGEVPLTLLFSGTIFHRGERGVLQALPVSWNKEAKTKLAVRTWREMMDLHYPNTAWLALRRDVFESLQRFKVREGMTTFDEAVERALRMAEEPMEVA